MQRAATERAEVLVSVWNREKQHRVTGRAYAFWTDLAMENVMALWKETKLG